MMSADQRPAYVEFEIREAEDRKASIEQGHYVPMDVPYIIVTPPGGNLVHEEPAEKWLEKKRRQGDPNHGAYLRQFEAWKEGQEEPLEGTPIRSWPAVTPAQTKACLGANIRTVEDLATAPEPALQRIGMGARALQQKAAAWLQSANDTGKTAEELATLRRDNEQMADELKEMRETVAALKAETEKPKKGAKKQDAA